MNGIIHYTGSLHTGVFAKLGSSLHTNGDLNPLLLVGSKMKGIRQYRSTWPISMIVTVGYRIVFVLCGQDIFIFCFKLILGCPVTTYTYFTVSLTR